MNYSNQALTVFVTVQAVNVCALITDYILMKINLPLITEICTQYPLIGGTVVAFETLSPVSIGLHFYFNGKHQ